MRQIQWPLCRQSPSFCRQRSSGRQRENVTRFCIDCVVAGDAGVLLGRRTGWPLKDMLCFVGGGVLLGDGRTFENIAMSKVESETGLVVAVRNAPIGNYSLIFKRVNDDENGRAGSVTHDITLPLIADVVGGNLKRDAQHSSFLWLDRLRDDLHPYVKQVLEDSGLFPEGSYKRDGVPCRFAMRTQYSEE